MKFGTKIWVLAACGLLLPAVVFGAFSLKKKEISCEDVKSGIGYYMYFMKENPAGFESLDKDSAVQVNDLLQKSAAQVFGNDFSKAGDMSQAPYSLDPAKVVKMKMGGLAYDIDAKLFAAAAKGKDIKYAISVFSYEIVQGPKEGTNVLSMQLEELPPVDLESNGSSFKAFNFLDIRAFLVDLTAGTGDYITKEQIYSYREWFMKKYPDFMSGKTNQLPEGVSYNAASQYQLFIQDSLVDLLSTSAEYKTMKGCAEAKP